MIDHYTSPEDEKLETRDYRLFESGGKYVVQCTAWTPSANRPNVRVGTSGFWEEYDTSAEANTRFKELISAWEPDLQSS